MSLAPIQFAYLSTITFSSVQMLLYAGIPVITETTGVSAASFIASISLGSLIFAIASPYWAARSDSLGRKRTLSIGLLGLLISFSLIALIMILPDMFSSNIKTALVYLSRILYGLLAAATIPVSQAWQIDLCQADDRIKVLTRNSMCLNLGRILAPALILLGFTSFKMLISFSCLWIITLLFLSVIVKDKGDYLKVKNVTLKGTIKDQWSRWREAFSQAAMPLMLALFFTSFIGILHTSLGPHMRETFSISGESATEMMAKIMIVLSFIAVVIQQIGIKFFGKKWIPRLIIGTIAIILGALTLLMTGNVDQIWLPIAFISIGIAFIPPVYLTLTSLFSQEKNGRKIGAAGIAHSLGYSVGTAMVALGLKTKLASPVEVIILVSLILCAISFTLMRPKMREAAYES